MDQAASSCGWICSVFGAHARHIGLAVVASQVQKLKAAKMLAEQHVQDKF